MLQHCFLAKFQINIGRLHNRTSVSNMPQISSGIKLEDNSDYVWDIYEATPIMSTYTIGMAVLSSNFTYKTRQSRKRNIRVISIDNYSINDNETSEIHLSRSDQFLQFYEDYYKDTDSVPKVDSLHAVSGKYAAMENWGLITYFSTYFGYKSGLPLLIGHEVAHYWHGNKVTCSNWNE